MRVNSVGMYAVVACMCSLAGAQAAHAQAWNYPSFQPPRIPPREFSGAVAAGGDAGTSLLGQWREPVGERVGLAVDVGFADPDAGDARFFFGGALGLPLLRMSEEFPLDLLLTGGGYLSFGGDITFLRFPVGASLGRRIPLEGESNFAITPFVHPRLSFEYVSIDEDAFGGFGDGSDTDFSFSFDIGGDFEISPRLSLKAAIGLGDEDASFGFAVAFRPARGVVR